MPYAINATTGSDCLLNDNSKVENRALNGFFSFGDNGSGQLMNIPAQQGQTPVRSMSLKEQRVVSTLDHQIKPGTLIDPNKLIHYQLWGSVTDAHSGLRSRDPREFGFKSCHTIMSHDFDRWERDIPYDPQLLHHTVHESAGLPARGGMMTRDHIMRPSNHAGRK